MRRKRVGGALNLKKAFLMIELMVFLVSVLILTGICSQALVSLSSGYATACNELETAFSSWGHNQEKRELIVLTTTASYNFQWMHEVPLQKEGV